MSRKIMHLGLEVISQDKEGHITYNLKKDIDYTILEAEK